MFLKPKLHFLEHYNLQDQDKVLQRCGEPSKGLVSKSGERESQREPERATGSHRDSLSGSGSLWLSLAVSSSLTVSLSLSPALSLFLALCEACMSV